MDYKKQLTEKQRERFAFMLKQKRLDMGLTISDLAYKLGYSESSISCNQQDSKTRTVRKSLRGDVLEIQGLRMVVKFGSYRYLEPSNMGCQSFAVVYDGLGFYVKTFNVIAPDDISPFEPETLKESVVIGNEFENPELLEAEE